MILRLRITRDGLFLLWNLHMHDLPFECNRWRHQDTAHYVTSQQVTCGWAQSNCPQLSHCLGRQIDQMVHHRFLSDRDHFDSLFLIVWSETREHAVLWCMYTVPRIDTSNNSDWAFWSEQNHICFNGTMKYLYYRTGKTMNSPQIWNDTKSNHATI